jgi:hypothetical protein
MFLHNHENIRKIFPRLQIHYTRINLTDLTKLWVDAAIFWTVLENLAIPLRVGSWESPLYSALYINLGCLSRQVDQPWEFKRPWGGGIRVAPPKTSNPIHPHAPTPQSSYRSSSGLSCFFWGRHNKYSHPGLQAETWLFTFKYVPKLLG